ncbi:cytidylyltransferase domain-containing protein [Candidatus Thiosymbion oneisti]|uniref:cytidylyltransferase domain-containing protein n=1 Tax=Candidatus Thiosymbion oneisti TaxID=589554 RepID=UPI003C7A05F1
MGREQTHPTKEHPCFAGRPIVCHSIAAAQESRLFDHIAVPTDDAEIASVARQYH